ncbi:hypothetical protein [Lysinibacillus sp. NPDC086135]|uniref:hypothetical protein n=1 Tax=Lysinibacillus sp. NPDC086135 TaxID=3364130 RepID=UPI0037F3CFEE
MGSKILEYVVPTIILSFITFIATLMMSYFSGINSVVSIGTATSFENNKYVVPINIQSYNTVIKDLQIVLDTTVTKNQIKTNMPVDIKIIDNHLSNSNGTTLEISQISKDQFINLLIITDKKLNKDEVKIYPNENKIDIFYGSMDMDPIGKLVKNTIITSIIYAAFFFVMTYITDVRSKKRITKYKEERDEKIAEFKDEATKLSSQLNFEIKRNNDAIKRNKDEMEKMEKEKEKLNKESIIYKENNLKKQILLQAKLNDYSKELNFWRNTIRKMLYTNSNKTNISEEIFDIVSKSLKTYQTNERTNHDFEALKVLSKMIKDIEDSDKLN